MLLKYLYDLSGRIEAETDNASAAVIKEYLWLDDMPVAVVDDTGASPVLSYIQSDHLATPQKITDGSGAVVWDGAFDPFGNAASITGTLTNNLRFPGQYFDAESGLNQNWNRDYDPTIGRYIESDPIGLDGGENTYAYVSNEPVNLFDLGGLDVWIEGPAGNEPSFHQSTNVGNPNGSYDSYSYGMNGNGLEGEVYRDISHGGPIEDYKSTTPAQDAAFKKWLEKQVGKKGIYGWDDICRSWSQRQFKRAPGIPRPPPPRIPVPHQNVSPFSSRSTTGVSSTTGTGTSR